MENMTNAMNMQLLDSQVRDLEEEEEQRREKVEKFKKAARAVLAQNNPTIEDVRNVLHFAEQI